MSAPTLRHFDPTLLIHVKADASNFTVDRTLSQYFEKNLYLVAFLSRKLSLTEQNYEIYDKEMLVIVNCFNKWRYYR